MAAVPANPAPSGVPPSLLAPSNSMLTGPNGLGFPAYGGFIQTMAPINGLMSLAAGRKGLGQAAVDFGLL